MTMENDTNDRKITDGGKIDFVLYTPEKNAADWVFALACSTFAILCVRPFLDFTGLGSDEAIVLQGAVRILKGEIPYRDFFVFFTPGSYYLYAGLFWAFGATLQAAQKVLLVYAALFSFLTYMLARRASSRHAAVLVACLLALICLPSRFQSLHSWD